MSVKDFENNRWSRDDQKLEFRHRATLSMINQGTVLDLGSGDGFLLSLLREKGINGKGLDLSEKGVSKATTKGLDTQVFDFGNEKLPFPDNSFDTVIILDVLEHLYDPEFLLREAKRVSKKDIVVGVPNFSSLPARIQMVFGKIPENNHHKKGHVFWFSYPVLMKMFTDNQLSLVVLESNTFFESIPFLSLMTKFFKKVRPNVFSLSFVAKVSK